MLKIVYTFFIGLLLATFVGVGIATFYPAPKYPDYPQVLQKAPPATPGEETAEQKAAQDKFDQTQKEYQQKNEIYNRNISMIIVGIAVLILAISLLLMNQFLVISDGLMLGGVFTLFYGIGRGFEGGNNIYRFIVVTVGLLIAILLGYFKFIRATPKGK